MPLMKEVWYCSHCGHEVSAGDEFCVACEFVFAGTEMAARSRLANRHEENGDAMKRPERQERI
jgi:hypothetical protein